MGVPVWYLHESLDRLARLANDWPRVALGSSGQFRTPGTPVWWGRMQQAMETACDEQGRPKVKLQGLRMPRPSVCKDVPLASADSAGVSQSIGFNKNWGHAYRNASDPARAHVLVDNYEGMQSAVVWKGIPAQEELFG